MSAGTALPEPVVAPSRSIPGRRAVAAVGRSTVIWVGLLCALGAGLRFYRLGHQGFWYDEANTALLVHFSLGKMIGLIPQTESTPPLYYCLAWVWARVFGFGEDGLRSLSAAAGVATVPVAYLAGAKLVSRRTGLIVASLCATNPFLIWYSQEARSYGLLVLFSALALLAFAYVLDEQSPRRVGAWVLCCALALVTHYYAVVVVAPQLAWLAARHFRARPVQIGTALVLVCGLALVPLAVHQNSTGRDSWIGHSQLGIRLGQVIPQFLIGTDAPARTALKFVAMALVLAALAFLVFSARNRERRCGLLAAGLALSGFVLSLVFVAGGKDTLITRNIIGLWLPAAIAVAAGLGLARPRALGWGVALALCAIGVTATLAVAFNHDYQRPDWRVVARELGPRPSGGPRVILIQHYRTLLPLLLYLPRLQFLGARGIAGVGEVDVIAMSSPQQPLCWWGAACNLIPSRMQAAYDLPGFRPAWRRRLRRFTILRLVAAGPRVTVTPAEVSRALSATTLRRDDLLVQP